MYDIKHLVHGYLTVVYNHIDRDSLIITQKICPNILCHIFTEKIDSRNRGFAPKSVNQPEIKISYFRLILLDYVITPL